MRLAAASADRAAASVEENQLDAFCRAYGYEALARAEAIAGRAEEAKAAKEKAEALTQEVDKAEDKELLVADLATITFE